jgi:uncharacterized protein YutE (UPF0331/DUF86 family)
MTPAGLDVPVLHAKLRLMRELLDDLEALGPLPPERLGQERIVRYAVERMLTQLVDLAVAVNAHCAAAVLHRAAADYRESFALMATAGILDEALAAELAPSVGLRNVLTHEYVAVDLGVVARSVPLALSGYRRYVGSVADFLLR